ncbi:MAG: alpha,4-digalacturonate transport system permease protein [Clostridiales bacterium]|nr:alpha,4-digalacturonate transport system permease protein [Clostridiales bacterium]
MNKKKQAFSHTRAFWLFVAPSFILFTIFFLIPLVLSIGFSFTNFDGWKTMDFIGIKNYTKILQDVEFYKTMGRTFVYALVNLPFKVMLPLLVAVLVTTKLLKGTTFVRTIMYIPVLLSALVVGITINWMFGQEYGLINFLIQSVGGKPLEWALNPKLATFVISFASNWASLGYFMILFIGGINNIPGELFEAANVDGATKLQVFFRIMIPMLSPTIFIVVLLSTVNLLKEYALIQGITLGGPGTSTTYVIQYMFNQGFNQYKYGYASAVGVVVSVVFIIITIIQFKLSKGGGEV